MVSLHLMMNYLRMILEIPKASQDQIGYYEACPGTYKGHQGRPERDHLI